MTRIATASVLAALLLLVAGAAAAGYTYPRFQPVSIAFVDKQHGVVGEDDWTCQKTRGCQGRILVTGDAGARWRVTYVGARGIHLYPVAGTRVVYAMTGSVMLKSVDAGGRWQRLTWPPAVVSFVSSALGWKIGPDTTLAHPPPLEQTRDGGQTWSARVNPCRGDYGLTAAISFATAGDGWVVCNTQATAGYQGKEVLRTVDGGTHWTLEGRTHPLGPPEPKQQVGNLPGYGYPIGATFLSDGRGWLLQGRGNMLVTSDGGHTWRDSPITKPDTIAGQSAYLLTDELGFVLLRGCTVRLVRTADGGKTWTTLERWNSPTQCTVPVCRTSQLHVWVTRTGAAAGTVGGYLAFTNRGAGTCSLSGWPALTALRPGASSVAVHVHETMFGPYAGGQGPPVRGVPVVQLQHGQTAVAAFTAGDHGPTSAPCPPPYRQLRVTPPGNSTSAVVPAWIAWYAQDLPSCTGIEVSMVVPASDMPPRG